MMDVLLFNLAELVDDKGQEKDYLVPQILVPPLGLLYVGQMISTNGYSVKVYDQTVTGIKNTEIMKLVKKLDPKIVGFSVLVDNLWTTIDLFKRIKSWNPNIVTVAGGYFATFYPEKLMKEIDLDFCIRGEGEYTFVDLVDYIFRKKTNFEELKGLTYRENNVIKSTPMPESLKNLDELPIPDRKLIDFSYGIDHRATSILSSRGCPFGCRFCVNALIMGKRWRPRSAKSVVEEIQLLKEQGYKDIFFVDDNFSLSKKRIFQICAGIKRNHLDDFNYHGDCRIDNVSLDLFRALVSCNFKQVLFGIENGNQRLLDYYRKDITLSQIEQAIKTVKKSRMELVFGAFIFGAPDETLSESIITLKFALKLKLDYTVLQVLTVQPMSLIYQELVEKKLYTPREDDWKWIVKVPDICPTAVPTETLLSLIDEGFLRLYNRRGIIKLIFDSLKKTYYIDNLIKAIRGYKRGVLQNGARKTA